MASSRNETTAANSDGYSFCVCWDVKDHGEYEVVKDFEAPKLGHTITAVFNLSADTETGFLSCFSKTEKAIEFLT